MSPLCFNNPQQQGSSYPGYSGPYAPQPPSPYPPQPPPGYSAPYQGQSPPHMKPAKQGRVSVATFLAPLIFMGLHYAVLSVMTFLRFSLFMQTYAAEQGLSYADLLLKLQTDGSLMTELMAKSDASNYASFYTMLIVIPIYSIYLYYRKKRCASVLLTRRVNAAQVVSSFFIALAAVGLTQLWMIGLQALSESWPWLMRQFQTYVDAISTLDVSTSPLSFRILVIAVLVPLGEELLFRGIVQGEIRRAFGPTVAVVATTILFSVFHMNFIQSSYVLIAGLAISGTYELTEQIAIPIFMHMVFNLIGSGLFSQLIGSGEAGDQIILYVMFAAIVPGIVAVVRLMTAYGKKRASDQNAAFPQ